MLTLLFVVWAQAYLMTLYPMTDPIQFSLLIVGQMTTCAVVTVAALYPYLKMED